MKKRENLIRASNWRRLTILCAGETEPAGRWGRGAKNEQGVLTAQAEWLGSGLLMLQ